tara:strand:+ start:124 stop:714 length:591 start_codon:yes stop_codon:yes gene_type:complete
MKVVVYGSSSKATPDAYTSAARVLGRELAKRGHVCVNGAGANGVMGALNESCKQAGGRVRGVCHAMFVDGAITQLFDGMELIQVSGSGLAERKAELARGAHCFIALPGGPGTWDELWEAACARQLGIDQTGPVVLVNTSGYYDGFVMQLKRAHEDGLLHKPPDEFLTVVDDPIAALDWCEAHAGDEAAKADVVVGA